MIYYDDSKGFWQLTSAGKNKGDKLNVQVGRFMLGAIISFLKERFVKRFCTVKMDELNSNSVGKVCSFPLVYISHFLYFFSFSFFCNHLNNWQNCFTTTMLHIQKCFKPFSIFTAFPKSRKYFMFPHIILKKGNFEKNVLENRKGRKCF